MPERVRIQKVFNDIHAHRRIADLIRRFSSNRRDVRQVALEGLDLRGCRRVLDLGCAFGSFAESLRGRVHPAATITGVDVIEAYEPLFCHACQQAGFRGRFLPGGTAVLKTFPDRSFHLILCSYALYFFPEVIPHLSRLLGREGIFIAITHHRRNAGELIDLAKNILGAKGLFRERDLPFEAIIGRFAAENGEAMLKPWFQRIKTIDYPNTLVFPKEDTPYLLEYFRFKSPLYFTGLETDTETLLPLVLEDLERVLAERNGLTISKDDRIFICTQPRQGEEKE